MSNPLLKMVEVLRAQYSENQTDELTTATQMELAAALALIIPVPAQPLGRGAQSWVNHNVFINRMLDEVNELYLLDLPKVKDMVKKLYAARYNFVHAPTDTLAETNALVKSLVANTEDAVFETRDLTTQVVRGLADAALELQKQYSAEVATEE
jgi:hypothetical protein